MSGNVSSRPLWLSFALACSLSVLPLAGALAQTPPAKPVVAARPVAKPATVQPAYAPAPNPTYQRAVQQQGVQNRLQQNAVEEQIRQQSSNNTSQNVTDPTLKQQTGAADNASQNLYRARQQSVIDRYQALPTPVGGTNPPQQPTPPPSGQ